MADPFHWANGSTTTLVTGAASAYAAFTKLPNGKGQFRYYNAGSTVAFLRKMNQADVDAAVAATAADFPLPPGITEVLTLSNRDASPIVGLAIISPGGAGTVYFTPGDGI